MQRYYSLQSSLIANNTTSQFAFVASYPLHVELIRIEAICPLQSPYILMREHLTR